MSNLTVVPGIEHRAVDRRGDMVGVEEHLAVVVVVDDRTEPVPDIAVGLRSRVDGQHLSVVEGTAPLRPSRAPPPDPAGDRRGSPHPLPRVPLPHQPGVTPLAEARPRLPRAVDRLPRIAEITPAEFDLHPEKLPGIEDPR